MIKLKIEAKHIKHGRRCSMEKCPIALAGKEQYDETTYVGNNCIGFDHGKFIVDLPQIAKDFIFKYDTQQPVEPFEFEVEGIPDYYRHGLGCEYSGIFCGEKR